MHRSKIIVETALTSCSKQECSILHYYSIRKNTESSHWTWEYYLFGGLNHDTMSLSLRLVACIACNCPSLPNTNTPQHAQQYNAPGLVGQRESGRYATAATSLPLGSPTIHTGAHALSAQALHQRDLGGCRLWRYWSGFYLGRAREYVGVRR
jgi:hypothetical protein